MSLLSRPISFAKAFTRTPAFAALAKTISQKTAHAAAGPQAPSSRTQRKLTVNTFIGYHRLIFVRRQHADHYRTDHNLCRALPPRRRGRHAPFRERGLVVVLRVRPALRGVVGLGPRDVHRLFFGRQV